MNALSALADGDPDLESIFATSVQIAIPVIVLGEYRYGIRQSRHAARYERWVSELLVSCRVLDVNQVTADHYAAVRAELKSRGRPIPSNDLWIAALARQHSFRVLSRDRHFDFVPGLKRMSW